MVLGPLIPAGGWRWFQGSSGFLNALHFKLLSWFQFKVQLRMKRLLESLPIHDEPTFHLNPMPAPLQSSLCFSLMTAAPWAAFWAAEGNAKQQYLVRCRPPIPVKCYARNPSFQNQSLQRLHQVLRIAFHMRKQKLEQAANSECEKIKYSSLKWAPCLPECWARLCSDHCVTYCPKM